MLCISSLFVLSFSHLVHRSCCCVGERVTKVVVHYRAVYHFSPLILVSCLMGLTHQLLLFLITAFGLIPAVALLVFRGELMQLSQWGERKTNTVRIYKEVLRGMRQLLMCVCVCVLGDTYVDCPSHSITVITQAATASVPRCFCRNSSKSFMPSHLPRVQKNAYPLWGPLNTCSRVNIKPQTSHSYTLF